MLRSVRPTALTTPAVTVDSKPSAAILYGPGSIASMSVPAKRSVASLSGAMNRTPPPALA